MEYVRVPPFFKKLVVLDRDGVINQDRDDYVKSVEEWVPIASSLDAIATLKAHGFLVYIATNQSGIGRGYYSVAVLEAMHQKLHSLLQQRGVAVDGIAYCPHTAQDLCDCRKPKAGLLDQLRANHGDHFGYDFAGGFIVGDSLRDLEAGVARKLSPILVRTGKGLKTEQGALPEGTQIFDTLQQWVDVLIKESVIT